MNNNQPLVIYIMGVCGVGKSTIGSLLSKEFSIPYYDGDDFHPEENVKKMQNGQSLNDDDRYGWLKTLNSLSIKKMETGGCIIACSALKEKYRDILQNSIEKNVKWVFLNGSFELISERLKARKNHYMPPTLLKSQFNTLEIPVNALGVDISKSPEEIVEFVKTYILNKSEFGLIGLGVMGKSLCRNLASKGFNISLYNRHLKDVEENVAVNFKNEHDELKNAQPFDDLQAFVNSLQQPRKIMLMVNAGKTVDIVIDQLLPFLSENDVIIDGGNSHYNDTETRINSLQEKQIHFIGTGVSGGEEGALKGPSIMPSGNPEAYKLVKPFLETIAAKDKDGNPCCTYIGKSGSGHFSKMVHNGIEYAEMQLLAEVYQIFKSSGKNPDQISDILSSWKSDADSYLLEISSEILKKKENTDSIINKILDKAGNKGTGNWTTIASAQLGVPSSMIASSLFARYTSAYKDERVHLNELYSFNTNELKINTDDVLKAYQLARIINHYQGFKLLNEASKAYNWDYNLSEIARIWTNGCIIRSSFMEELISILDSEENILTNKKIIGQVKSLKPSLAISVSECVKNGIPVPCLSEAINSLNAITLANSSANIIQAQRDYFGAHTYQRNDDTSEKYYHTNWKK